MIYSGNKLFNANNAIGAGLVLLGVVLSRTNGDSDSGFLYIVIPIAFIMTAAEAFYFEITLDELIVRNYMIPFLKIHYKLDKITQIRFRGVSSKSTADARLQIVQANKQSMRFSAASLRMDDWQEMVNDFSKEKIPVSIEAYRLKSYIGVPED